MADYWEDREGHLPAYKVSCKHCGADLWERWGQRHEPPCPRADEKEKEAKPNPAT